MAKLNIKKGDNVLVLSGKEKGKKGKVLEVIQQGNTVIVEGINIVSRNTKPKNQQDKGGIIKKNAPMKASKLMVICDACGKATRIARKEVNGKNVRVCKKCGAVLDKAFVKQAKKVEKKTKDVKETKEVKETKTATKNTDVVKKVSNAKITKSTQDKTVKSPAVRKTATGK